MSGSTKETDMKWLDRFMPSDFPNFILCGRESETVDREIKVHSEHQSHSEKYQERSKGQSMHQSCVQN